MRASQENYAYAKKIVLSSKLSQLSSNFENELDLRHGKNGFPIANRFLVVFRSAKVHKFTLNTCGTAKQGDGTSFGTDTFVDILIGMI